MVYLSNDPLLNSAIQDYEYYDLELQCASDCKLQMSIIIQRGTAKTQVHIPVDSGHQ